MNILGLICQKKSLPLWLFYLIQYKIEMLPVLSSQCSVSQEPKSPPIHVHLYHDTILNQTS